MVNVKIPDGKDYVIDGNTIIFSEYFNQCLSLYHHMLLTVTHVTFNDTYPNTSLFNAHFPALKNIISIIFGSSFNKPFVPTKYVIHLAFGRCFNQRIVLSKNIKNFSIGGAISEFNQPIDLSKNIVVLRIFSLFVQTPNLTKKIKCLIFTRTPVNNLMHSPKYLFRLILSGNIPQIILNKTIKVLELHNDNGCTQMCVLDSTTNVQITYSPIDYFTRDGLPNSIDDVYEYCPATMVFPTFFNNIPNCLVQKISYEGYGYQHIRLMKK